MKRITEKVKDIVEVRPFGHVDDFAADPQQTLLGYHFTDITADLMANWLGRISNVKGGRGGAYALAGFRGVGKSHFLAAAAAIVSSPDLRSKLGNDHVAAQAGHLSRRAGPVAFVRRGSGGSLVEELQNAIAQVTGTDPKNLSNSIGDLLLKGCEKAADAPLVVFIDTAAGRESRVARNDGPVLSEIAEAAKSLGVFVGLALDDDISGADGSNAAIVTSFTIDYLDQEHLYQIVDSHIFKKHERSRPLLHEIYEDFRATLPGFRWSEQRFAALYPLHPAMLEVSPLVRLYIHDFALLAFASEAGERIMGRPADSLIALDEMFDNVESRLRHVPQLTEAFEAFDRLDHEVVSKTAVKTRLQAKLVLKGLFLLSLDGQSSSADDIAAAMMILGEEGSVDAESLLASFASACPAAVIRREDGGKAKYLLGIDDKEDINALLAERAAQVPDEAVWKVLLRQTAEKFADMEAPGESPVSPCTVEWRGGIRRGEIVWDVDKWSADGGKPERLDWVVIARRERSEVSTERSDVPVLYWQLAELSDDEQSTLRRHHLLQTDTELRERFEESLATATQVHALAVERIWQRVFLQDGCLVGPGGEIRFPGSSVTVHTMTQVFTEALDPVFTALYSEHPQFAVALGMKETASLVANFFAGSAQEDPDTQRLAHALAHPLGLTVQNEGLHLPAPADVLVELDIVQKALVGKKGANVIPLTDISARLGAPPLGLTREAQHLVLTALVSQRQLEFITSSGNRINHRSLDLQMIWDDIAGVAEPPEDEFSPDRLLFWARTFTGYTALKSIDGSGDRQEITESLKRYSAAWHEEGVLSSFDALPDDALTTKSWYTAANVRRSFGAATEAIESLAANDTSLEQCLQRIAEIFSDSEAEFKKALADLTLVRNFLDAVALRGEITRYLSVCEPTQNSDVEISRSEVLEVLADRPTFESQRDTVVDKWQTFKELYADHYGEKHDQAINVFASKKELNEIVKSQLWASFDELSGLTLFDQRFNVRARSMMREMRVIDCAADTAKHLEARPRCSCDLSLAELERLTRYGDELKGVLEDGIRAFRLKLARDQKAIEAVFTGDETKKRHARDLITRLTTAAELPRLDFQDQQLLEAVAPKLAAAPKADDEIRLLEDDDLSPSNGNWVKPPVSSDVLAGVEL